MKRIIVIVSVIVLIITGISSCKKIRHELIPTRIEGTVVDILNGEAIPNAEITLWEGKRDFERPVATAQCDAQGKFKIKYKFRDNDDSDGKWRYSVSAKKDGYYKINNYYNINNSYNAKFDVNKEAIAQVEPTRANKNIVLKLIPLCSLDLYVEDVPPYYQLQNNLTYHLFLRFRPLESGTIGWKSGIDGIGIKNYITEFKVDTLTAGKYRLILYEGYNDTYPIVNVIDTFYVYLKPNQKNNVYLSY
jgi:5-hydroxyisourate hydrolase-like protein (transthyretin family)